MDPFISMGERPTLRERASSSLEAATQMLWEHRNTILPEATVLYSGVGDSTNATIRITRKEMK